MTQAIYVFRAPDRTKIGISNSPMRRIGQLRGRFQELSLAYAASTNGGDTARLERRAHDILAEHRITRDWFFVDAETAVAVLQAADELGFTLRERGETDVEDRIYDRSTHGEPLTVRFQPHVLAAIDAARAGAEFDPSRPDVVRALVIEGLRAKGYLK